MQKTGTSTTKNQSSDQVLAKATATGKCQNLGGSSENNNTHIFPNNSKITLNLPFLSKILAVDNTALSQGQMRRFCAGGFYVI